MTLRTGDKIVVESEKVSQPGRAGVIDGHSSILTPAAGAARIIQRKTRAKKA
jgi:hypothetical protein